jgi:hypothetical protein
VQSQTVQSARQFSGDTPIVVSPVTLKPRFNAVATGSEPPEPPGELPRQVDPRQPTLFAAGWTLGSIAALAKAGAYSVTCYETTGWRGVMETEAGTPLPEKFPSTPGGVFQVYHVLVDLAEFATGDVLPLDTAAPLKVQGLAVRTGWGKRIWAANMTAQPQTVVLPAGASEDATRRRAPTARLVRLLDRTTLAEAASSPERFREQEGSPMAGTRLELPSHAMARIDCFDRGTA